MWACRYIPCNIDPLTHTLYNYPMCVTVDSALCLPSIHVYPCTWGYEVGRGGGGGEG